MRAHVGDEARLLADQAVNVGWVHAHLTRFGQHFIAVGRGEALGHVDLGARALAGIDAAVPDLAFTSQLRAGKQLAVIQATQGVVPLSHAFVAQTQGDELQRARKTGLAARAGALSLSRRRCGRNQREFDAQFLSRQFAVEVMLCGQLLQGLSRGCAIGVAGGTLFGAGHHGAGAPVGPGAVIGFGGAHGVHSANDLAPWVALSAGGSQCCAHVPSQGFVAPGVRRRRGLATQRLPGLGVVFARLGRRFQGRLFAHAGPGQGELVSGQAVGPGARELPGHIVGVIGRHAHQGQQSQLCPSRCERMVVKFFECALGLVKQLVNG